MNATSPSAFQLTHLLEQVDSRQRREGPQELALGFLTARAAASDSQAGMLASCIEVSDRQQTDLAERRPLASRLICPSWSVANLAHHQDHPDPESGSAPWRNGGASDSKLPKLSRQGTIRRLWVRSPPGSGNPRTKCGNVFACHTRTLQATLPYRELASQCRRKVPAAASPPCGGHSFPGY